MKRANVHQGDFKVTADEGNQLPFSIVYGNDDLSLSEQDARDLFACLDAALIQWEGRDEPLGSEPTAAEAEAFVNRAKP